MKMKLFISILFFGVFALVFGDPESSFCCKPGQGVLSDDGRNCTNNSTNTITPTKLLCEIAGVVPISLVEFRVSDEGILIVDFNNQETYTDSDKFCVANGTVNTTERLVVLCSEEEEAILDDRVLGHCLIVSVIFLTLTALVYSALPKLRDLQGKSLVSFCASLAIGMAFLSILKLMEYENMDLCAVRGFLVYLFLIASFFWTNAISIQILLSIRRASIADYRWKPFLWYALYSWGIPILLTVCMVIVNYHPGRHPKPGIGLNTCWFYDKHQQWYYMYSVMTILILANICIFVYLSINLCCHTFASSHIKALRYKFVMTVRMFIIMGLPWIFEMISSVTKPHIIWVLFDIFNTLQGPLIFLLLVVLRKRVIKAMYEKGWLDCISGLVERHLAIGDDEEDVVEHMDVDLDERPTQVPTIK
ncbi:unnamed protein product, partial [Brenthis ino]